MMFGKINLIDFGAGLTSMPQDAATEWSAASNGFVGAKYKPLLYCGYQLANGINYFFVAEETTQTLSDCRHLVKVLINGGKIIRVEEMF